MNEVPVAVRDSLDDLYFVIYPLRDGRRESRNDVVLDFPTVATDRTCEPPNWSKLSLSNQIVPLSERFSKAMDGFALKNRMEVLNQQHRIVDRLVDRPQFLQHFDFL